MSYIPHTDDDTKIMLDAIGVPSIEALFDEIPKTLRYEGFSNIPSGMTEQSMLKMAHKLAQKNQHGLCFIGAGSYSHHIPAVVKTLAARGEFRTSYTPYQAEASQGTLQLLYEFQTMIAELTGMDVANASLYDGATALAEAVLMAIRLKKSQKTHQILIVGTLHPFYRETLETMIRYQPVELITLPFNPTTGVTVIDKSLMQGYPDLTAIVMVQPNFFGCLEPVDALCDWAFEKNIIRIACVNPTALGLLKPPGEWGQHGVDIACGEGQPLGVPMSSGGPYIGFISTKIAHVRQMPGRLIGRTLDKEGKEGFSLTLQAREQHIRREKATSNICTNQGLLVVHATIYMTLLGPNGLKAVATTAHNRTTFLLNQLTAIPGISRVFSSPYFHEVLLQFEKPLAPVLSSLRQAGIDGGYPVEAHFPLLKNTLLVCATEMIDEEDILYYASALRTILGV